jgi:hypothetical protein
MRIASHSVPCGFAISYQSFVNLTLVSWTDLYSKLVQWFVLTHYSQPTSTLLSPQLRYYFMSGSWCVFEIRSDTIVAVFSASAGKRGKGTLFLKRHRLKMKTG